MLEQAYEDVAYYSERGMFNVPAEAATLRAKDLLERAGGGTVKVLDFGAGPGHLVAAFQSLGVCADGVEPSTAGRDEARRRYQIELLRTVPRSDVLYDLIVLLHSLEHVLKPVSALRSLRELLAPEGFIFIDVPNAASFEMLRPACRRKILDLPLHLYHFTPQTLSQVLRAAGLQMVNARLTNPDWLEWLLSRRASRICPGEDCCVTAARDRSPHSNERFEVRRIWRQYVLPFVRERFPGWRFEVLAKRSP